MTAKFTSCTTNDFFLMSFLSHNVRKCETPPYSSLPLANRVIQVDRKNYPFDLTQSKAVEEVN